MSPGNLLEIIPADLLDTLFMRNNIPQRLYDLTETLSMPLTSLHKSMLPVQHVYAMSD